MSDANRRKIDFIFNFACRGNQFVFNFRIPYSITIPPRTLAILADNCVVTNAKLVDRNAATGRRLAAIQRVNPVNFARHPYAASEGCIRILMKMAAFFRDGGGWEKKGGGKAIRVTAAGKIIGTLANNCAPAPPSPLLVFSLLIGLRKYRRFESRSAENDGARSRLRSKKKKVCRYDVCINCSRSSPLSLFITNSVLRATRKEVSRKRPRVDYIQTDAIRDGA